MNIITVVFKDDHANLLYQAYSLKKNWQGTKAWTIIPEDGNISRQFITETILPIMEGWVMRVPALPEISLGTDNPNAKIGWHRQQILKLWAASTLANRYKYSLILDAKNFLINPIDESWFFVDGKQKVQVDGFLTRPANEFWKNCCKFFDIYPEFECWTTTPWVWKNELVKDTIQEIKNRGFDIYTSTAEQLPVWEFYSYWLVNYKKFDWVHANFSVSIKNISDNIPGNDYKEMPFFTLHRKDASEPKLVNINNSLLKEKEIVDDSIIRLWYKLNGTSNLTFKLIYANGDSFVAGSELAISKFVPELATLYTQHENKKLTVLECQKLTKKHELFTMKHDLSSESEYQTACKLLAFPQHIGDKLSIPVINNSLAGQSNQTSCSAVIEDMDKLLLQHKPEEIFVIVGLTSWNRVKIPKNGGARSIMLADIDPKIAGVSAELCKYYISTITDDFLFTDNLIHVLGLMHYLEHFNISYIFTDSHLWQTSVNDFARLNRDMSLVPTTTFVMSNELKEDERVIHERGHYSQVIHQRFADRIIDYIKSLYNEKN